MDVRNWRAANMLSLGIVKLCGKFCRLAKKEVKINTWIPVMKKGAPEDALKNQLVAGGEG